MTKKFDWITKVQISKKTHKIKVDWKSADGSKTGTVIIKEVSDDKLANTAITELVGQFITADGSGVFDADATTGIATLKDNTAKCENAAGDFDAAQIKVIEPDAAGAGAGAGAGEESDDESGEDEDKGETKKINLSVDELKAALANVESKKGDGSKIPGRTVNMVISLLKKAKLID